MIKTILIVHSSGRQTYRPDFFSKNEYKNEKEKKVFDLLTVPFSFSGVYKLRFNVLCIYFSVTLASI